MHALRALDQELVREGFAEPVRVRAAGGFALLWHGLRANNSYTADVDSVVESYSLPVRQLIEQVGCELGLESTWLNTDVAGDDPELVLELWDAAFIVDTGARFALIDLQVADVPTLTRAKAIAVDTDAISGRERDWDDLLDLLQQQGISSYREFCAAYPEISEWEYPQTHQSLESWFRTGVRAEPEGFDLDGFEF